MCSLLLSLDAGAKAPSSHAALGGVAAAERSRRLRQLAEHIEAGEWAVARSVALRLDVWLRAAAHVVEMLPRLVHAIVVQARQEQWKIPRAC